MAPRFLSNTIVKAVIVECSQSLMFGDGGFAIVGLSDAYSYVPKIGSVVFIVGEILSPGGRTYQYKLRGWVL